MQPESIASPKTKKPNRLRAALAAAMLATAMVVSGSVVVETVLMPGASASTTTDQINDTTENVAALGGLVVGVSPTILMVVIVIALIGLFGSLFAGFQTGRHYQRRRGGH